MVGNFINITNKNKALQHSLDIAYKENRLLASELYYTNLKYTQSKPKTTNYTTNTIPSDTIDAVKYAMTKSHPDNGGKIEDFIKYRNVYETLTKKNIRRT